ncbi:MAG: hypothetical protein AAFY76_04310 [Cyanobacteria bacterium J06649_11]
MKQERIYKTILNGDKSEVLSISLEVLLKTIPSSVYRDLNWALLWFEAMVSNKFVYDLLPFENEIKNSSNGKLFSFEELLELSQEIKQGIEILIIADPDQNNLRKYESDEEMQKICFLTAELVDSSYWEISTRSEQLISILKQDLD